MDTVLILLPSYVLFDKQLNTVTHGSKHISRPFPVSRSSQCNPEAIEQHVLADTFS
jgi:ribosomal protein L34E